MPRGHGDIEVWSHLTNGTVDALFDSDGHLQVDVLSSASVAVTGTFWQTTQPVSLASVPSHAVTQATASSLKCEEASASAIKDAVEIMDDWDDSDKCKVITQASTNTIEVVGDAAEDAAVAGNPLLFGGRYDTTARELDNGDVGAVGLSLDGNIVPGLHPIHWNVTIASADASSATQVKAAGGAGKRYYITSLVLSTDTAMNMQIQDDAGSPVVAIEDIHLAANGGMVYPIPAGSAIMMGTDNQDIDVITSASGNISVTMTGFTI